MSNDDVLAAQIKSSIITKIKTQEYLPGELLPSERDFATMYSVSRYLIHKTTSLIKPKRSISILFSKKTARCPCLSYMSPLYFIKGLSTGIFKI